MWIVVLWFTFIITATATNTPMFNTEPVTVTVVVGETAILPCAVSNLGKYTVQWTAPNDYLLTYGAMVLDPRRFSIQQPSAQDWNLRIIDVRPRDEGEYICTVSTRAVKRKAVFLKVKDGYHRERSTITTTTTTTVENRGSEDLIDTHDRLTGARTTNTPVMNTETVNVTVLEGETAMLPCDVSNVGRHKVIWADKSRVVLTYMDFAFNDDPRLAVIRPRVRDWNLRIRDVSSRDNGAYYCRIGTNPSQMKTVFLKVKKRSALNYPVDDNSDVSNGSTSILSTRVLLLLTQAAFVVFPSLMIVMNDQPIE